MRSRYILCLNLNCSAVENSLLVWRLFDAFLIGKYLVFKALFFWSNNQFWIPFFIFNCIIRDESSKYWLGVLTDIKNRGVHDILITAVDGLPGFQEAIEAVFPMAEIQRCIVHQIRNSCEFVNYKDRKEFCADMRKMYLTIKFVGLPTT